MVQIVIIEDESLIRLGVTTAINNQPSLNVCGEASTGENGIKLVEEKKPDIVLVDIGLPDMSGLEVTSTVTKNTSTRVIVLTCNCSAAEELATYALNYGAKSFLLKKSDIGLLLSAIAAVSSNKYFVDPAINRQILEAHQWNNGRIFKKGKKCNEPLTKTETEVLKLIARGLSNEEIAQQLFVTLSTVKSHTNNLLIKLNARNRSHAIIKAIRLGYLNSVDLDQAEFDNAM